MTHRNFTIFSLSACLSATVTLAAHATQLPNDVEKKHLDQRLEQKVNLQYRTTTDAWKAALTESLHINAPAAAFIDLRPTAVFQQLHFNGTLNIPLKNFLDVPKVVKNLDTPIWIFGASKNDAEFAVYLLQTLHYTNLHVVSDDFETLQASAAALLTTEPATQPALKKLQTISSSQLIKKPEIRRSTNPDRDTREMINRTLETLAEPTEPVATLAENIRVRQHLFQTRHEKLMELSAATDQPEQPPIKLEVAAQPQAEMINVSLQDLPTFYQKYPDQHAAYQIHSDTNNATAILFAYYLQNEFGYTNVQLRLK